MAKPLLGRTILITRSPSQAPAFRRLLQERGAAVLEVPVIEIRARAGPELDSALRSLRRYDWLIFTSANGAAIFFERARELDLLPPPFSLPRICAIGPATQQRVTQYGYQVDLVPAVYQAEGVLEAFLDFHRGRIDGLNILLPRASQARQVLPQGLRRRGARVSVVPVYDIVIPEGSRRLLEQALAGPPPDLVTFTSPSTVRNFLALGAQDRLAQLRCAVIGPVTAATARKCGLEVVVEAEDFTIPHLVEAIEGYFRAQK